MKSRARLLGHPIHQMLIVLPLGLFVGSILFDILNMVTASNRWADTAMWAIIVGVVSGLVAAVFGFVDWTGIPKGTRARSIGAIHGIGNVIVVIFFLASALMRARVAPAISPAGIVLSWMGGAIAMVTGWLGGELVNRLGIGVHEDANANAPSSLSHRRTGNLAGHLSPRTPGRDVRADEPPVSGSGQRVAPGVNYPASSPPPSSPGR